MAMQRAWDTACASVAIPSPIADEWFAKLAQSYRESPARSYHNARMMDFKFDLLEQLELPVSDALALAICFQYFVYDVRQECSEQNVQAVREFYEAAQLNNVRELH